MNVMTALPCNMRCRYCFAPQQRGAPSDDAFLSLPMCDRILEFLRSIGINQFRMIGGEPTLHPAFSAIVDRVMDAGFTLHLFTNGLWSDAARRRIQDLPPARVKGLINVNAPDNMTAKQRSQLYATLEWAGQHNTAPTCEHPINLGVNIFDVREDYGFVLELAIRYGINVVRMSPAFPVVGEDNVHVEWQDYRHYGSLVHAWARWLHEHAPVQLVLDCVVPVCRTFTPAQVDDLLSLGNVQGILQNRCSVTQTIFPDGRVDCCFVLSRVCASASIEALWGTHHREIEARFVAAATSHLVAPPMPDCLSCDLYPERCQGGCLGYSCFEDEGCRDHGSAGARRLPVRLA